MTSLYNIRENIHFRYEFEPKRPYPHTFYVTRIPNSSPSEFYSCLIEISNWLHDNLGENTYRWEIGVDSWCFRDASDAMLFKLTF